MRENRTAWIPKILWLAAISFAVLWTVSALLPREPSAEALRYFGEDFLRRAKERATPAYVNSGLASLATFAALYLFSRSAPFSGKFRSQVTGRGALGFGFLLGSLASAMFSLVGLPFSAYSGYFLEKRFGLSRMTLGAWIVDYLKASAFNLLAYGVGAAFLAWAIVRMPRRWHYAVTVAFIAASLVMSALYPLVIAPAFDEFHPLDDEALLRDVRNLSGAAGMRVDRVMVMEASAKTTRVNAYFAGVGRTKQVVLYDTLIETHSPEEIRFVLAHELGHWKHGHIVKANLLSVAGVLICMALYRMSVPAARKAGTLTTYRALESALLALLVFIVLFSYVVTPVSSYVSRSFERTADAYSLELTGNREAFVLGQVNLAKGNLSDVEPPPFLRWFAWTHPTALDRIKSAE